MAYFVFQPKWLCRFHLFHFSYILTTVWRFLSVILA